MANEKGEERLSEQLVIRVSMATKKSIEALAAAKGIKHTAYVRDIVERSVRKSAASAR